MPSRPCCRYSPLVGGRLVRSLPIVNGAAIDLPNVSLPTLAGSPLVSHLSMDRVVAGAMERTGATIGATAVRQQLGYDGAGVGVAVIDSGITPWHDDLIGRGRRTARRALRRLRQRAVRRRTTTTATARTSPASSRGNGFDSDGARAGIAPGAHLIVLKVLDGDGQRPHQRRHRRARLRRVEHGRR